MDTIPSRRIVESQQCWPRQWSCRVFPMIVGTTDAKNPTRKRLRGEDIMTLIRRHFLQLAAAASAVPAGMGLVFAQAPQGGPKLTQILRSDLRAQDQKVQETVVNLLEMPPGAAAPWHMHPGAQELLFAIEGDIVIEIQGQASTVIKAGTVGLIPAEIPHLARNERTSLARALVTHSRAEKEKPPMVLVKQPG